MTADLYIVHQLLDTSIANLDLSVNDWYLDMAEDAHFIHKVDYNENNSNRNNARQGGFSQYLE